MKKWSILPVLIVVLLVQISLISAIDLTIKEKEITSQAIIELDKPALFELTITNNEQTIQELEIYSIVGRVDLEPSEPFTIIGNATKTLTLEVHPRNTPGRFSFEYKIKNNLDEIQTDQLVVNIVNLEDAFELYADSINLDSETATLYFKNKGGHSFSNIKAEFSSVFFDHEETFSLKANEEKQFVTTIDQEQAKQLLAGPYILNGKIKVNEVTATPDSIIRFTEQSGLDTNELNEGFLLRREEVTKINRGNVPTDVEILIKKSFLPALLTTFNIAPTNKDTVGMSTYYIFQKTLAPGEELKVVAKTNWWFLLLILIAAIFIVYLVRKHALSKLKLTKKATFVKTKGGEFALKINLILKARDFVERIKVVDRLPGMVKLYERYGTISPDKVDHEKKRIEWDLDNLDKGEERVFSYIIYSKMGILGKFELPEAEAFYEFKGQLKESKSNKSFFVNEPGKKKSKVQRMVDDLL
jgi:hypothetical protein